MLLSPPFLIYTSALRSPATLFYAGRTLDSDDLLSFFSWLWCGSLVGSGGQGCCHTPQVMHGRTQRPARRSEPRMMCGLWFATPRRSRQTRWRCWTPSPQPSLHYGLCARCDELCSWMRSCSWQGTTLAAAVMLRWDLDWTATRNAGQCKHLRGCGVSDVKVAVRAECEYLRSLTWSSTR